MASAGTAGPGASDWDCGAGSDPAVEPEGREDSPKEGPAAQAGESGSAKGGGIYNGNGAMLTNTTGLVIESNVATGNAGGNGGGGGNASASRAAAAAGLATAAPAAKPPATTAASAALAARASGAVCTTTSVGQ